MWDRWLHPITVCGIVFYCLMCVVVLLNIACQPIDMICADIYWYKCRNLKYQFVLYSPVEEVELTPWSRATHICVSKLTIIGSDNGLSPGRRRAIIWTSAGILIDHVYSRHFWQCTVIIVKTIIKTHAWVKRIQRNKVLLKYIHVHN